MSSNVSEQGVEVDEQQHRDPTYGAGDREQETAPRVGDDEAPGSSPSGGFSGRGPRGYQRSSERIYEEVCESLTEDDRVDASDIDVEAENGIVILRGTVADRGQKRRAEDIAERASGVRDVRNQLEIESAMLDDLSERAGRSARDGQGDDIDALGSFRDPSWAERDLRGFEVEARDGKIGSVDESSASGADHLIVDTGPWIFGRKVVLPVGLVEKIDFEEHRLLVSRSKEEIKDAPDFDEKHADDPRYAEHLRSYYSGERDREGSMR